MRKQRTVKRAAPTKGERFESLENTVKQLHATVKVNQMMFGQMANSVPGMQNDLGSVISKQRELQYRVLAMQEMSNLKIADIDAKSLELQVRDFDEVSAKENVVRSAVPATIVADDSTVVLTTTTPSEDVDKGIFRSKVALSDISVPGLKEALIGTSKGATVTVDISGVDHLIEVLDIVTFPVVDEAVSTGTDVQAAE